MSCPTQALAPKYIPYTAVAEVAKKQGGKARELIFVANMVYFVRWQEE